MSSQRAIELGHVGDVSTRPAHYISRTKSTPSNTYNRNRPHRQNSAPMRRDQLEQDILDQLPSRQIGRGGTLRWNRTLRGKRNAGLHQAFDQLDAAGIVDNLLQDDEFVEESLEQQTEDIRDLPTNLGIKKSIKTRIRQKDKAKAKRVGWVSLLKSRTFIAWRHFKSNLAELGYASELWRGHLKILEGKFGSGVTSYFIFLRWLLLLNIPVFIVLFSFLTIPQLLHRTSQPSPYPDLNVSFTGVEILTGEGWFRTTELYYGVYTNETINRISGTYYEMPLAYLLTIAAFYCLTLFVVLYSLTKSYRKNFIDSSDTIKFKFVTKVLCGWDYAIVQDADLRHKSLLQELQEFIATVNKHNTVERSRKQKFGLILLRIFTTLAALGLIYGAGHIVYLISSQKTFQFTGIADTTNGLRQLALPAVISALIFILPFIFALFSSLEKYSDPRVEIYLTMARIILLFCAVLGVLVFFWFNNTNPCSSTGEENCNPCWENFLGETIYRLVIVDFIVTLLVTFFSEFVRKLFSLCFKRITRPTFNIGRNTLYLIYSQALIWLGTYYSPLLSILAIIKLVVFFYVKRYSVTGNCRPSAKSWRGGQTHTIILALLVTALLLCFIAVGFSIVKLKPSVTCGPYPYKETAYQVISDKIDAWAKDNKVIAALLEFFTSSGFLVGVITGLIVLAYYSRIRAKGLDEMIESLKCQIANEVEYKKKLTKILHQQGPARKGDRRARTEDNYASPGGRKFAKQTLAPVVPSSGGKSNLAPGGPPGIVRDAVDSNSAPGAPKPSPSVSGPSPSEPVDIYNDGFVDKSWEQSDFGAEPGVNLAYKDNSLSRRPNLPYSAQHYDIYRKK